MTGGMTSNERTTLQGRVKTLEAFAVRQGETIQAALTEQVHLRDRVSALEETNQNRLIVQAREDERDKALYGRLDGIDKRVSNIEGLGSKALWVFISAIVLAFAGFMIKGGLG